MNDKDVVTREQVFKWYRLAGMDDMFTETRVAMLADFAIFAREDARRTVSGQEAKPIGYVQASAIPVLKRGGIDTVFGDCHECADVPLYAAPIPATELERKIIQAIAQAKTTSHACDAVRALLAAAKEG